MSTISDNWASRRLAPRIPLSRAIISSNTTFTGTGAESGAIIVDLEETPTEYHEGIVGLHIKTTNGQGTATTPGAGKTITIKCGFINELLASADVATICQSMGDLLTVTATLPDTASSAAAGQRVWTPATNKRDVTGRYFFAYWDKVAFGAAASSVLMNISLVRI